jgi:copper chaperone
MKIFIKGMMCEHCVAHVTQALKNIEGLSAVKVNLQDGLAEASGTAAHAAIQTAIEDEGYDVVRIEE